ncbi:hypothetical protein KY317_02975, partial [Candidatus Woesearchaeota archaeon]|nr:hypothetical protein [Candidatus Woesearchaeota archaeon]
KKMQKKIYKILGILFLFLGISLFTLTRSSITGAVIGIGIKSQTTFILGLISFAVSAGLFIIGRTALEKIVSPEEFAERVNDAEDDPNKRAIIIDSSAVLDYSPEEVKEMLDRYDAVFVPKEVLKEVKNKERNWGNMNTPRARLLESHIREHKTRIDEHAIGKYQEIARKYLGQTEKAKFYQKIAPILEEENPKKREQMTYKLPHALRQRYINMTRKTLGYIREEREKSKSRKERRRPITVSDLRKKN